MLQVILKLGETAFALQEAKALRTGIHKSRDLQRLAVGNRTPQPFMGTVQDLEARDLMCGRADVVAAPVQRAKHIGPGHGRNAVMVDIGAREQCAFGVDDRRIARAQGEAIGTGHALGIKQGMHDDGIAGERRLLDPDGAERRRLLAAWVGRADRQAACHDTEVLMIGACAKETRPLEDRNLRHPAVNRAQDAETREAQVTYIGRNRDFSEIEKICRIGEPSLEAILDEVDLDLCRKNGAAMQGLDDETGVCVFPDMSVGLALDADIEIVGQACERVAKRRVRGLVGTLREVPRHIENARGIEALGLRHGRGRRGW